MRLIGFYNREITELGHKLAEVMVVGSDYEQKSSQFKSQQKGHGYSVFYGHGEGKDENKTGINKYLREVDKGYQNCLRAKRFRSW